MVASLGVIILELKSFYPTTTFSLEILMFGVFNRLAKISLSLRQLVDQHFFNPLRMIGSSGHVSHGFQKVEPFGSNRRLGPLSEKISRFIRQWKA